MQVERILCNGRIITMDQSYPEAQAIAIADGRFLAVGSNDEVLALKREGVGVVDLQGATVIPGLNDSHMHLTHLGSAIERVDLTIARSRQDLTRLGAEFLTANSEVAWLLGWGWNHEYFGDRALPSREDLDSISTEVPILFSRACVHIAVANSRALELAGIGVNPEQPHGGQIDVDANGVPTGILRESAMRLVTSQIPEESIEDYKRIIRKAAERASSFGLTSVQSDDLSERMQPKLEAYKQLVQAGELPVRVNLQIRLSSVEELENYLALREQYQFPEGTVEYGPIKLMTDGSLGGRTAAMNEPYADDPTTTGVAPLSQDEINAIFQAAHAKGLQISGHAIGDRAMELLLNGFELVLGEQPTEDARPRIIHAQITTPSILERCRNLGVICDIQPAFVGTDLHMVESRIGTERMQTTYVWKTMREMGIHTAGGSDAPVESCNPFIGIQMAITRQDLNNYPEGGWLPEQKLTLMEALELYTRGSAYATFDEGNKGSITVGKLADFVVLADDLTTMPVEQIHQVRVTATYVGGQRVSL